MCPHTTLECVLLEIRLCRLCNKRTSSSNTPLPLVEGHPPVTVEEPPIPFSPFSSADCVAHAPSAMVLFFLFLFLPLTFAFVLTAVAVLYKPGCAVSAADTSSV